MKNYVVLLVVVWLTCGNVLSAELIDETQVDSSGNEEIDMKWKLVNGREILSYERTHEILLELMQLLNEAKIENGIYDQVANLFNVGNLPKDACNSKIFIKIDSLIQNAWPEHLNLISYLNNCKYNQQQECAKNFILLIANFNQDDLENVSTLINIITQKQDYHTILIWEHFNWTHRISGLLEYLQLATSDLGTTRQSFEEKFNFFIVDLCKRIQKQFDLSFFYFDPEQARFRTVTENGWITKIIWCNSILESKTELIDSTYKLLNKRLQH